MRQVDSVNDPSSTLSNLQLDQKCKITIGGMNKGMDVISTKNRQLITSRTSQPKRAAQLPPSVNATLFCMKENVSRNSLEDTFLAQKTPIVDAFSPQPSPTSALETNKV
jgi:hypothetical protein